MSEIDRGTKDIVCTDCKTSPRLKSLNKNSGTVVGCDCDDVKHSMDTVPYEYSVNDLPESWVVIDGRPPKQIAREVDAMIESGEYKCPGCGNQFSLAETASCGQCGYIPEEVRA